MFWNVVITMEKETRSRISEILAQMSDFKDNIEYLQVYIQRLLAENDLLQKQLAYKDLKLVELQERFQEAEDLVEKEKLYQIIIENERKIYELTHSEFGEGKMNEDFSESLSTPQKNFSQNLPETIPESAISDPLASNPQNTPESEMINEEDLKKCQKALQSHTKQELVDLVASPIYGDLDLSMKMLKREMIASLLQYLQEKLPEKIISLEF